ncbi:NlpC/P60 family protein [Streptomyces sp. NBC_01500]|uniref:C40 family peptidase n=2 Tax=unclassified Streptomyces TaxID=2593676 RepID=UPI00224E7715|nr:NlpC/P60 family protein [Streptomyces sp. NBC_01500]MCX4554079.1 NlpC/P60 family protein [Streptomyces sp. NBC_01500]
MASHRRPKPASRTRVTVLTATAAAAVALTSQAAHADPKPTKSEVKAQVDKLSEDTEKATEKLNGAQEQQDKLKKQVGDLQDTVARGQQELNKLRGQLGSMASAQYRSGGIDPSVQLFLSSDPDNFLDKATAQDQLSTQQADALKKIQAKQRTLAQQRSEAQDKLKDLASTRKKLAANKQAVQGKLAESRKLLQSLTAAERAAITADDTRANRASSRADLGNDVPASARGGAALNAAKTQIGKPYQYTATGMASWDCSGLTQWAYAQANVSLPRVSQAQANAGQRIYSQSALKPGDLVLFYGDLHHIGLYAGNGMVLHAPHTGANVRYEAMGNMPFQFGVRIG